jgi:hypothetical protein
MNRIPKRIPLTAALLAAGLAAADSVASYQWEAEARPVLAEIGIAQSSDPKIALRASGAIYLLAVYGGHGDSRLGLAISNDGGDSFEPPIPISEPGKPVSSHGENSPSIAFGGTEVYVLWEERIPGQDMGTELLFARSLAFGRSFEKPIRVTHKTEPSTNAFSYLAAAPNGYVYAVWLDGRDRATDPPGTSSVYLARSTDRGASFGSEVRVAGGVCPCCRPTVAFGRQGQVYVAWRQVFPGSIRDIAVAASGDGGATFGAPVRVAADNWKINGCPHSGPSLLSLGGRLWVTWFSDAEKAGSAVWLAWSDDGAKTFSGPRAISEGVLDPNHPVLSEAADGRILTIFQGRDGAKGAGWSPTQAYLAEIAPDGAPLGRPAAPGGHRKAIAYPVVAGGSGGSVFAAWTERVEQGRQIHLLRGRKASPEVSRAVTQP